MVGLVYHNKTIQSGEGIVRMQVRPVWSVDGLTVQHGPSNLVRLPKIV